MKAEAGTPPLSEVYFASSNRHKFDEAKSILDSFGVTLKFFPCVLEEIQSDSIGDIARHKAKEAFAQCKKPVIVEDDGLCIAALGGFPGPYSSFVFGTIGNRGILNLVAKNRKASFESAIVYNDRRQVRIFTASVSGRISQKIQGKGWGYDPIFIPARKNMTFAQINDKNLTSHRYKALKLFADWFVHM